MGLCFETETMPRRVLSKCVGTGMQTYGRTFTSTTVRTAFYIDVNAIMPGYLLNFP